VRQVISRFERLTRAAPQWVDDEVSRVRLYLRRSGAPGTRRYVVCVRGAHAPRPPADRATVRRRGSPEEWSPREDEPSFKPMYRNERVAIDRILRGE